MIKVNYLTNSYLVSIFEFDRLRVVLHEFHTSPYS